MWTSPAVCSWLLAMLTHPYILISSVTHATSAVCPSLSAMLAHFVVLPNFQDDEAMFRETLVHLGLYISAEKHVRTGVGHRGP